VTLRCFNGYGSIECVFLIVLPEQGCGAASNLNGFWVLLTPSRILCPIFSIFYRCGSSNELSTHSARSFVYCFAIFFCGLFEKIWCSSNTWDLYTDYFKKLTKTDIAWYLSHTEFSRFEVPRSSSNVLSLASNRVEKKKSNGVAGIGVVDPEKRGCGYDPVYTSTSGAQHDVAVSKSAQVHVGLHI
jgi:hypothetical protein